MHRLPRFPFRRRTCTVWGQSVLVGEDLRTLVFTILSTMEKMTAVIDRMLT